MKELVKQLINLARQRWGDKHLLFKPAMVDGFKCKNCGVLYFGWDEASIMETECQGYLTKLHRQVWTDYLTPE